MSESPVLDYEVHSSRRPSTIGLAMLTLGATALAGGLLWHGLTTPLEAISFVTGAVCVWLTVRQSLCGLAHVWRALDETAR